MNKGKDILPQNIVVISSLENSETPAIISKGGRANKMADLRADATNTFERLASKSVGDTTALTELIEKVFSTDAKVTDRAQALRDLQFTVKTKWKEVTDDQTDQASVSDDQFTGNSLDFTMGQLDGLITVGDLLSLPLRKVA